MAERTPTVSVVMPVFNAAPFLREAIVSVLDQTFTEFEFLIINDGSTDGSDAIVRSFSDTRIRYMPNAANRGLVAALNQGLDAAKGRYIARMDADDVMQKDRLEKQFLYMEADPGVSAVASFVDFINTDGEVIGVWDIDRAAVTEAEIAAMMPRTTCIAHPTVMFRSSALGTLRYDPRMTEGEDWELWLRMRSRGLRIAKIPEALLRYRQHPSSFTSAAKKRQVQEPRLLRMRQRFLLGEWRRLRFNALQWAVIKAQVRSVARHLKLNVLPPLARDTYRVLTYNPIKLIGESRRLRKTLRTWKGEHVFLFPYLSMGGAEQVHADIVASVADKHPLVIMCGFSSDRAFEERFAQSGTLLEVPRLVNHPWTRRAAHRAIARATNGLAHASVMSSLTSTFFELLPLLDPEIRTYFMVHAFLYQPGANVQHKAWLKHFDRITGYLFPSEMARKEFDRFLFHNGIPSSRSTKLLATPCAVPLFGAVQEHERTGILLVGRDSPEKRLHLFLRIADELERKLPGRFRFTVVGAVQHEGHPHVSFTGIVKDPGAMTTQYDANDLLVLTSTREGFSLVVMEAMARGLAVVSTPVGDVPSRVGPSTGILTSTGDEGTVLKEMVDGIFALDSDRQRLRNMKLAALALSKTEFDPATFRERYRALLLGNASM
ncbi:MAG TPA: glycosyltransferase [Flavobacteriales bacterium]|nr:glycosyltransferase [Flavobacteriales bacterium]